MSIAERKHRERAEREHRIIAAARTISEAEGWGAVTIRRLAEEIEHSQPVLYSHFENRDAIIAAVAIEGFGELAAALRDAAATAADERAAVASVAATYLAFARANAALYAAMFTLPSGLRFAEDDTRPELKEAFAALAAVIPQSQGDAGVATETFWAVLHGLAELEGSGRIRRSAREERVRIVTAALCSR